MPGDRRIASKGGRLEGRARVRMTVPAVLLAAARARGSCGHHHMGNESTIDREDTWLAGHEAFEPAPVED